MLSKAEVHVLHKRVATALANLGDVAFFWCPVSRRLYARSRFRFVDLQDAYLPSRGRGGALPATALLVGCYEHGHASVAGIVEDVRELMRPGPPAPTASPQEVPSSAHEDGQVALPKAIPATHWQWARPNFHYGCPPAVLQPTRNRASRCSKRTHRRLGGTHAGASQLPQDEADG